jgi:ribosomal protein S4
VANNRFAGDFLQADAFDHALGAGEIAVDKFLARADRFKNLRAAVGLVGGNAHLGHHLEDALGNRLGVMLVRFGFVQWRDEARKLAVRVSKANQGLIASAP